ncbi:MAG: hypothetical protein AM326_01005 [Candidatus Thorarchaeota archaeon SMTZ-45]|jgi:hypothetical protein|nr:MAG: hypothetical protein AM326_01005 [Candidatus Thorarchaeota archaeon SMTZ-45]
MKIGWIKVFILAYLIIGINQGISSTDATTQYFPAQTADLQFTADSIHVSVEQGGSNTAIVRVHNYGDIAGSANISFAGSEPDGITVDLSATSIVDLAGGSYQDITATITAAAGLWPLGPRRLDLSLKNGTTELDATFLEMDVIAPTDTTPPPGIFGIPLESIVLSVIATAVVLILIVVLRKRK